MTDETFAGTTVGWWERRARERPGDAVLVFPDAVIADVRRLVARAEQAEADRHEMVRWLVQLGADEWPCVVSADGEVTPLPDGLVILVDGAPHTLRRCPQCEGRWWTPSASGHEDATCPVCADSPAWGWVAVPLDPPDEGTGT